MAVFNHLITHPLTAVCSRSETFDHFRSLLFDTEHSDVPILCFGHLYHLHRVILCRVDFFKTLIDGSWRESGSGREGQQPISITFPPPINQAAFELCLSRIYGTGPKVLPPPWALIDDVMLPLGRTHALLAHMAIRGLDTMSTVQYCRNWEIEQSAWANLPQDKTSHPAPPRFLLSLHFCADYLGMSKLVTQTTKLVMSTITPFTVITYLEFSLGRPLKANPLASDDDLGCRSLENLGRPVKTKAKADALDQQIEEQENIGNLHRGALIGRLGNACASWLSKWASDLLILEEKLAPNEIDELTLLTTGAEEVEVIKHWPSSQRPSMRIWRYVGGLSSDWIRVLISSDAFFMGCKSVGVDALSYLNDMDDLDDLDDRGPDRVMGSEWQRFRFARRVTELREHERATLELASHGLSSQRRVSSLYLSNPDHELVRMFRDGIYYSHMVCDEFLPMFDHHDRL